MYSIFTNDLRSNSSANSMYSRFRKKSFAITTTSSIRQKSLRLDSRCSMARKRSVMRLIVGGFIANLQTAERRSSQLTISEPRPVSFRRQHSSILHFGNSMSSQAPLAHLILRGDENRRYRLHSRAARSDILSPPSQNSTA